MEATEICPLTQAAVQELLARRQGEALGNLNSTRRYTQRWPFAGTAELWIPQDDQTETYVLATCLNLSATGMGIRIDEPLKLNMSLAIAVHQPEVSFHGYAMVRHCTPTHHGDYLCGLQFNFEK